MDNKYTSGEIKNAIEKIIETLNGNFNKFSNLYKKITYPDIFELSKDLTNLFNIYIDMDKFDCGEIIRKSYIKFLNLLLAIDYNEERKVAYYKQLENAYRLAGRTSLEHFIIYYEWNESDKILEKRYEVLQSYVYYLNKMCFDRSFEGIIANLPSGYGKSRIVRFYEAFRMGVENGEGTFLALCSNDDVIKGQSRSVIDIIKNPRYGDVFPKLRYSKEDRNFFLKETDGEWKLRNCKLISSYYAKTTNSNVVGSRASLSIDIDDLYADYREALDENLNKYYLNKFLTVWRKRYVQDKTAQVIVSGTMWSSTDFLTKLIDLWSKESKFITHPKLKYTKISQDGKRVIIQVPALDYVTGESTCPQLKSTEELLKERSNMPRYLWETNFQQNPISPEGLYFDYDKLQTYDELPPHDSDSTYASLDPNRKGNDYISMPIHKKIDDKYYLVDCYFSQMSVIYAYDEIVAKIINNHVIELVIENNTNTSLKDIIEKKLHDKQYYACKIYEKYDTKKKEVRINENKDVIVDRIVYPRKGKFGINSMVGKAMEQMTSYSFDTPNKHDDMIDSEAIFADQIILGNAIPMKAVAINRPF